MADYHSPTVVTPVLPVCDLTALERLILNQIFDAEDAGEGRLYLHADVGPSDFVSIEAGELRAAHAASVQADSVANSPVAVLLAKQDAAADADDRDLIDLDLSDAAFTWSRMLQDIVRRSVILDEIVVWTAFTCSRMRPDGFGGSVTRITAQAIQHECTISMLERMWNEAPPPDSSAMNGRDTQARFETSAALAGWDGFTLILLIARWAERTGHAPALIEHLDRLAVHTPG